MCNNKLACLSLLLCAFSPTQAEPEMGAIKLSGYYLNMAAQSTTYLAPLQAYTLDLSRLRLQLQAAISTDIALDVQYDNEILLGNYVKSTQFQIQKHARSGQYWKSDSNYFESDQLDARHRWYRASIAFTRGATDLKFGRQRIAWGTGRFWSPLDLLNPIAPTQLEREERPGVDALLVERRFSPLSRLSFVYAPQHENGYASAAMQFHGNLNAVDYSIVFGRFQQDRTLGVDIATQLGNAGLRAELTYTHPATGRGYRRSLIGLDYAFENTLTLAAECYYNGRGATNPALYDFEALFAARQQSLARSYAGIYAGYEITPLLKWNNYAILNLDDRSRYLSTRIVYSLQENLDWHLGLQKFGGRGGSEYGNMPALYYTQLQWYF